MSQPQIPQRLDSMDAAEITRVAEDYGKRLADHREGIETNQVRNVFAHVNRMRVDYKKAGEWTEGLERTLILLKPKLAYAAGRNRNVRPFQELLSRSIDAVVASENKARGVENFFALVEGIVAYHKFHGGN